MSVRRMIPKNDELHRIGDIDFTKD